MKYQHILWEIAKEIEEDDPHFEFVINLLSYCLHNDGLTKKQSKIADKYYEKYGYLFEGEKDE